MKIKKNDNVVIITGKDRGKTGKVLRAFPKVGKVLVEGVNVVKRHTKPRRSNQKGQIVDKPMPIDASNVALVDSVSKASKPVRAKVVRSTTKKS